MLPVYIALVALAVPAIVTNTYAGMTAVDPDVKDAARGQGMRAHQVLLQVELPLALPLIMTGLRLALIQVVATATIAAYVSFGGLGRYVFDGLAQRDLVQVLGGAVLVAAVAVVLDLASAASSASSATAPPREPPKWSRLSARSQEAPAAPAPDRADDLGGHDVRVTGARLDDRHLRDAVLAQHLDCLADGLVRLHADEGRDGAVHLVVEDVGDARGLRPPGSRSRPSTRR
ncbi:hypothetical protein SALBM311S_05550 [Streptomyces alboniger]